MRAPAFRIDAAKVTNAEYFLYLLDAYPLGTTAENAQLASACPPSWRDALPDLATDPRIPLGIENDPVRGISYDDAEAFARWAGKRLPTEREWEHVARCGIFDRAGHAVEWTSSLGDRREGNEIGRPDFGALYRIVCAGAPHGATRRAVSRDARPEDVGLRCVK